MDHAAHRVELYYDNTAEWCVNTVDQLVEWRRMTSAELDVMRIGTSTQAILKRVCRYAGVLSNGASPLHSREMEWALIGDTSTLRRRRTIPRFIR